MRENDGQKFQERHQRKCISGTRMCFLQGSVEVAACIVAAAFLIPAEDGSFPTGEASARDNRRAEDARQVSAYERSHYQRRMREE